MRPSHRKFMLAAHLTVSIGWIGAVMAYLALVIAATTGQGTETLRAVWIAMELIGWYVIVPLSLAALLTGLVMALGTPWGLFRHYWVVFSLVLTLFATIILLQHLRSVSFVAGEVAKTDGGLRGELIHAGGGLVVLLVIQVLNVYKPRGLTPYGWRKQQERRTPSPT